MSKPHLTSVPPLRRRRFSQAEKLAILAEARDGESLSSVGRRHGIAITLLFRWKRALGDLVAPGPANEPMAATQATEEDRDVPSRLRLLESQVAFLWAENRRMSGMLRELDRRRTAEEARHLGLPIDFAGSRRDV